MQYFGTDGIRGEINKRLTAKLTLKVGQSLGKINSEKKRFIIGFDTRESCLPLALIMAGALSSFNHDITICGVIPTPGVSYLTSNYQFDYGIMISASHNPYYDNGIKIFNSQGQKISQAQEQLIEDGIDSNFLNSSSKNFGTVEFNERLSEKYIDYLVKTSPKYLEGLKICLDLANGATYDVAAKVFEKLGATVTLIHNQPNGVNINKECGSTHPEALIKEIKQGNYHFGFTFDGDGDRILMVDDQGNLIDGDQIIYLMAKKYQSENKLTNNKVVMTVMTNLAIINELAKVGIETEVCGVGDKYVSRTLVKNDIKIGGEQSGHIILREFAESGDGVLVAVQLASYFATNQEKVSNIFKNFKLNPQKTKNIQVADKEAVMNDSIVLKKIEETNKQLGTTGRVLVRASGTEELVRVMVEATSMEIIDQIIDEFTKIIN